MRFASMQPTAMRYDDIRPVSEREVKIAKATGDPMMKSESTIVIAHVKTIALTGTSHPGRTFAKNEAKGSPPSLAKLLEFDQCP